MTLRAAPKPEKPRRGDRACREHIAMIKQLPCVICGRYGVEAHHVAHDRFAQRKSSDMDVIPLCRPCHETRTRTGRVWREIYGPDHGFLGKVAKQIAELKRRTV